MKWTTDQLEAMAEALIAFHHCEDKESYGSVGCCLHVVTDDNCINNANIKSSIKDAEANSHPYCAAMGRLLLSMTLAERAKVVCWTWDDDERQDLVDRMSTWM